MYIFIFMSINMLPFQYIYSIICIYRENVNFRLFAANRNGTEINVCCCSEVPIYV
jgi:hypothetical protein